MGQALRITAQENREMRMQEAEQKAASLPAKLTVPMIIFFLPCLFVVILGPAIMKIMHIAIRGYPLRPTHRPRACYRHLPCQRASARTGEAGHEQGDPSAL